MNEKEKLEEIIIKYDVEINRIHKENEQLKQRIDKAINYINSQSPDAGVCGKTIKKILKGGSNE